MYILMGNELKTLHEQRLKDLRLEYVESVAQSKRWQRRLGATVERIGVWFALMGERMQATAEQNAAANLRRESMKPVRVRNR